MSRLDPLPLESDPAVALALEGARRALGFVPNSMLIMQRRPQLVQALGQLAMAVAEPALVNAGFKRLMAHVASHAAGCQYCTAHTADSALRLGVDAARLAAVWEFRSSDLFSEAERVALEFALAVASVPNAVTDELFEQLRRHWSEDQIVEMLGTLCVFGFLNRWNDSLATPLEAQPLATGERILTPRGWTAGKHGR